LTEAKKKKKVVSLILMFLPIMILINENPTLQNSLRSQQKSLQKKPNKNMNALFNKKKNKKRKHTHVLIYRERKKENLEEGPTEKATRTLSEGEIMA
jgi:hypothetical protein